MEKKKKGSGTTKKTKLCKYCKTEINASAKVCPNCKKKQGGGILKGIILVFIALVLVGALFGGGDDKKVADTTNQTKTPNNQESKEVSSNAVPESDTEHIIEKEEPVSTEEHFEVDLSAGNYTAGIDIPVGTYNLSATGGSGNVSSSNMFSGGLNEIMGNPADEYSSDSFNGLKLEDGVILTLGGTVTLHLTSENANVTGVTARTVADATPIDLGAGNYTCGADFPAGTYNIIATGGNGNVSSDNMFEGGLNEIMGTTNDGTSISQYNNASFQDGNTLTISGTSIKLVPVGE